MTQTHRKGSVLLAYLFVWSWLGASLASGQAQSRTDQTRAEEALISTRGMVVSVERHGSEAGADILRCGGNAVDAAVATALALAVTHPAAGNIGGGGFMMILPPGERQTPVCVEYRETAPAAAAPDMFVQKYSSYDHRAVGVPGTLRGLELAHRRFGKLPWRQLVLPAVRLAEEGFVIDRPLAGSLNSVLKSARDSLELVRVYGKDGGKSSWEAGDRLVLPDLARTLKLVAEQGADAFYTGPIARQIADEMKAGGGLITLDDLAAYKAHVRRPVHGLFRGYDVYGSPPPSSGGTCLVEMLNILENFDLRAQGRWSPETAHLIVETMKRAYCDRARHLGDDAFVKIPAHLTTKAYAQRLAAGIDRGRATPSEQLAPELLLTDEGDSTTHFSVIDADAMAVSNTYTLEHGYGARIVVRGAGFLLNNEMGDFNRYPGRTDREGNIGTEANWIAPGKRMLSSQTPVIVLRNGRVKLLTGSPGGRTIINTVLSVVLGSLEFQQGIREAVDAPRLHHQWLPDQISFEGYGQPLYAGTVKALEAMGHKFVPKGGRQGDAHSIWVGDRVFYGAPDSRSESAAAAP